MKRLVLVRDAAASNEFGDERWEPMLLERSTNQLEAVTANFGYSSICAVNNARYGFLEEHSNFISDYSGFPAISRRMLYIDFMNRKTATDIDTGKLADYVECGEFDYDANLGAKPADFNAVGLARYSNTAGEIQAAYVTTFDPHVVMEITPQITTRPPVTSTAHVRTPIQAQDNVATLDLLLQRAAKTALHAAVSEGSNSSTSARKSESPKQLATQASPADLKESIESLNNIIGSIAHLFNEQTTHKEAVVAVKKLHTATQHLATDTNHLLVDPQQLRPLEISNAAQIAEVFESLVKAKTSPSNKSEDPVVTFTNILQTLETGAGAATSKPAAPQPKPNQLAKKNQRKAAKKNAATAALSVVRTDDPELSKAALQQLRNINDHYTGGAPGKTMAFLHQARTKSSNALTTMRARMPRLTPHQELNVHFAIVAMCATILLYKYNEINAAEIKRNPRNAVTPDFANFVLETLLSNVALILASYALTQQPRPASR